MCNRNSIGAWLLAAEAAMVVAIVMLGIAIYQAQSIFGIFTSVGYMVITCAFVAAALGFLIAARAAAGGCATGACSAQGAAFVTALTRLIGMLSVLLATLLAGTFIPGAAAIAGPAALVLLVGTGGLFIYLGAMAYGLEICSVTTGGLPASTVFTVALTLAWVTGAAVIAVAVFGIVLTIQSAAAAASG